MEEINEELDKLMRKAFEDLQKELLRLLLLDFQQVLKYTSSKSLKHSKHQITL